MNLLELSEIASHGVLLGYGQCEVELDRRGIDLNHRVVINAPVAGERLNEAGDVFYLVGRLLEGDAL